MQTADEIIALERAALERWCAGDPSGFLVISAPDVVYFDPFLEKRLDGLDALTRYYEDLRGKISAARFDIVDPLVQVLGDGAVLTFNFVSYAGTEGARMRWNCTEAYRKTVDGWRIVQTHWSFTQDGR